MSFDDYDADLVLDCKTNCQRAMREFFTVYESIKSHHDPNNILKYTYGQIIESAYLSGGSIASVINSDHVKDYDIYFTDKSITENLRDYFSSEHGLNFLNNQGDTYPHPDKDILNDPAPPPVSMPHPAITANAITLSMSVGQHMFAANPQIITSKVGPIEYVIGTFDYEHCKPYYYYHNDSFHITWKQFALIRTKRLLIANPEARSTQERYQKFIDRGWTAIAPGETLLVPYSNSIRNQTRQPRKIII